MAGEVVAADGEAVGDGDNYSEHGIVSTLALMVYTQGNGRLMITRKWDAT